MIRPQSLRISKFLLVGASIACLMTGCGDDSTSGPGSSSAITSTSASSSSSASAFVSSSNSQALVAATVGAVSSDPAASDSSSIVSRMEQNEIFEHKLNLTSAGSLLQSLSLELGGLTSRYTGGSVVVNGTVAGEATITATNSTLTLVFSNFQNSDATINGKATVTLASGSVASGSYTFDLALTTLSVAPTSGDTFSANGSVVVSRTRSTSGSAGNLTTDLNTTVNTTSTITDVTKGSEISFEPLVTTSQSTIVNSTINCTQTYLGTLEFTNVSTSNGTVINGQIALTTPTNLQFSGTLSDLNLNAGEILLTANGAVEADVISTNEIQISL